MRVYWHCPFSCETENEAPAAAILVFPILIPRSYFQLNALKPGLYRFSGVYLHCPFSCAIKTEDVAAILIFLFIFDYWHNVLEAV